MLTKVYIFDKDLDKVLLVGNKSGTLSGVEGQIRDHETVDEAMARQLREKLGLQVSQYKPLNQGCRIVEGPKEDIVYTGSTSSNLELEADLAQWVPLSELSRMPDTKIDSVTRTDIINCALAEAEREGAFKGLTMRERKSWKSIRGITEPEPPTTKLRAEREYSEPEL